MFNPLPYLTYVVLMAFTPGPNNIMSMTNAGEKGIKKSFPFNLGIFLGISVVAILCAIFSSALYALIPRIKIFMQTAGAAYMIWLATSLLNTSKKKEHSTKTAQGFLIGALLQFINPKLYISVITAMSSYILPHFNSYSALIGFSLVQAFAGFLGTLCWAFFGAGLSRLFSTHNRLINIIMAILLLYCAVSLFF